MSQVLEKYVRCHYDGSASKYSSAANINTLRIGNQVSIQIHRRIQGRVIKATGQLR